MRMLPSSCQRQPRVSTRRSRPAPRALQRRPLVLEQLEDRLAPATFRWDGGGGADTSWHNAANWDHPSNAVLPGASDDAIIDAAFAGVTITANSNVTIHSLTSAASLQIGGGTFSIAADS